MCAGWQPGSLWRGSKARWLGELSDKCAAVIYHWDKELYTVMLTVRPPDRVRLKRPASGV